MPAPRETVPAFQRIRDNVQKMINVGAPEQDIDGYLATEGLDATRFKALATGSGQEIRALSPTTKVGPVGSGGISSDPSKGAGFWTNLRANLAPAVEDKIKRYAAARNIPTDYYGVDADGRIYYFNPDTGEQAYETPSIGGAAGPLKRFQALGDIIGAGAPPAIPQIAGTLAGAATGNPIGGPLLAGTVAGGTDLARQALDRSLAGESPLNLDYGNAALQAGGAAAFEGVGRLAGWGAGRVYNRNPGRLTPSDAAAVMRDPSRALQANELARYAENQGSFVSLGEAAKLPGQLQRERNLRVTPQGGEFSARVLDRAEYDVPRIAGRAIDAVSPAGRAPGADTAITNLRTASNDLLKLFRQRRSEAASPLYQEAYAANQSVMSPEISRILDTPAGKQALQEAATLAQNRMSLVGVPDAELGALAKELESIGKMGPTPGGVAAGLKLRTLDYVKQVLWDMGERAYAQGDRASGGAFKNLAAKLRGELDRLDVTAAAGPNSLKPEGGLYAQARRIFGDESSAVTESERLLLKFAGREDAPLAKSADTFFSARRTTPEETARTRMLFATSPEQLAKWDDAVTVWLADRFADAAKAAGEAGNTARNFSKELWRDDRQRKVIEAALGNDQTKITSLNAMFNYMRAVGRSLPEGSPTPAALQHNQSLAAQAAPVIKFFARLFNPLSWSDAVAGAAERSAIKRDAAKMIEMALKPENSRALQNLRMIGPKWERGIPIIVRIMEQAGLITARQTGLLPSPSPMTPPALLPAPAIP